MSTEIHYVVGTTSGLGNYQGCMESQGLTRELRDEKWIGTRERTFDVIARFSSDSSYLPFVSRNQIDMGRAVVIIGKYETGELEEPEYLEFDSK